MNYNNLNDIINGGSGEQDGSFENVLANTSAMSSNSTLLKSKKTNSHGLTDEITQVTEVTSLNQVKIFFL